MIIYEVLFPKNVQVYIACIFGEFVISECPSVVLEDIANLLIIFR